MAACGTASTTAKKWCGARVLISLLDSYPRGISNPNHPRNRDAPIDCQLHAPMFLKDPARIEGLLCCHFVAPLTQALIERQIRTATATADAAVIPLYPENRDRAAPSASRYSRSSTDSPANHLIDDTGHVVQVFQPSLTPLQGQVLDLLGIPHAAYTG